MNNLLKNLGIILLIIGAICLIASFYITGLSSNNAFTATSLLLCVAGLIVHIIMNKRITD